MFYSLFDKNNLMRAFNKDWHFISLCEDFLLLKANGLDLEIQVPVFFFLLFCDHGQVPLLACGAILEMME